MRPPPPIETSITHSASLLIRLLLARDLLRTLSPEELAILERALCNQEEPQFDPKQVTLISEYRTSKVAQQQQHTAAATAANSNSSPNAVDAKESPAISIPLQVPVPPPKRGGGGTGDGDGEASPDSPSAVEMDLPSDSSSQSIVEIDTPEALLPSVNKVCLVSGKWGGDPWRKKDPS